LFNSPIWLDHSMDDCHFNNQLHSSQNWGGWGAKTHRFFHCMDESGLSRTTQVCTQSDGHSVFFSFCFLDGVKEHSIRSLAHFRSLVFMTTWSLGHCRSPVFMTTWSLGRTSHRHGPTFVVDWEFRTTGDSWPKWWWPDWTSTHQWMDGWMDGCLRCGWTSTGLIIIPP
jgi:hypothetical protein